MRVEARCRRRIGHEEHAVETSIQRHGCSVEGVIEEGEIVGGRIKAEECIVSVDRGVCIWSRLLQSLLGFLWDGIVLKVIVGVVEGSLGFGGYGKWEVRNVVAVARLLLASTGGPTERSGAYRPKYSAG